MKYLDAQDVKAGRIGHTLLGPLLKVMKWLIPVSEGNNVSESIYWKKN